MILFGVSKRAIESSSELKRQLQSEFPEFAEAIKQFGLETIQNKSSVKRPIKSQQRLAKNKKSVS